MKHAIALIASVAALAGCQINGTDPVPAVLTDGSDATMTLLKEKLAEALDRPNVTLGAGDPTQSSTLSIAPPRLAPRETNSMAKPIRFDLMMKGDTCYAVHADTGEQVALDGIACRAL